ncbi:MAG: sulfotransferase, partial [Gammaproteobacteria bacterium]|nr:sulfotransferase [Gammaproteobacteria bacterium]
LAPAFRTIHPIGALLPQECIAITAHAFASVEFHTTFNVPSYQGWLDRSDHIDAFRLHRTFVQHLQRYRQASQWVFKAPAHIHALPAIVATYPEARFVFTDRDPAQVVASIASHGVVLRNAFSDCVDNEAVAREWMHWWADGKKAAEQFRKTTTSTVLDLHYQTLIADPIAAVASLYEQLGWHWNNELAQRMQAFLDENQQDKYGRHRYSLAQFGLHERDVEQAFAATK